MKRILIQTTIGDFDVEYTKEEFDRIQRELNDPYTFLVVDNDNVLVMKSAICAITVQEDSENGKRECPCA